MKNLLEELFTGLLIGGFFYIGGMALFQYIFIG